MSDAVVEDLYVAFADYPRFSGYLGCTHCVDEAEQDALRPVPLRALTVVQIAPVWLNAGVGTFGEVADFKHFLPRMFEVLLGERVPLPENFLLAGLRRYEVAGWPAAERRAVGAALVAWVCGALCPEDQGWCWDKQPAVDRLTEVVAVHPDLPQLWAELRALDDVRLTLITHVIAGDDALAARGAAELGEDVASRVATMVARGWFAADDWYPELVAGVLRGRL